jgi:hypothetical protein
VLPSIPWYLLVASTKFQNVKWMGSHEWCSGGAKNGITGGFCRTNFPGSTTQVGTGTDYSMGH